MTITISISVFEICIGFLSLIYLCIGFLVWREWQYTSPEMQWSTSKWKWIWLPAYKIAEFLAYVFLWWLVGIVAICVMLTIVLIDNFKPHVHD